MPPDQAHSDDFATTEAQTRVGAEELVRDNAGWMLVLAERMLNDTALAEDAVQEALISAINGLDRFEEKSSLKTWLHRITVNAALSKIRKQKRLAEQSIDEFLPEFDQYECRIEQAWTHLASAQDIAEDEEARARVGDCIRSLPDAFRVVLQLRDIEGYDTGETAKLLEISEANVKVRLHRARAALKKILEPILRGEEYQ